MQPKTKYVRLGGDRIAYQVLGQGPPDLVMTTGGFSQIDIVWEDPGIALFLRTLASFSRLILFDRLGNGLSDRGTTGQGEDDRGGGLRGQACEGSHAKILYS